MCGVLEQLSPESPVPLSSQETESVNKPMANPIKVLETEHSFCSLLELAADNDVEGFKQSISEASIVNEIGLWYGRDRASRRMVLEHRTPLMVASKYGSVDVVKLILSLSEADVNCSPCGDKSTALHCAASGGSENAVDTVKVLLLAGADPNAIDANGCCPFDVIVSPLNCSNLKVVLQELLQYDGSACQLDLHVSNVCCRSSSPSLSSSPKNASLPSSIPDSTCNSDDIHVSSAPEKKEYPFDPSLPNIKNSIYATDEFRMFSFKIWPCSRAYSHDWTECPFVHPGENARRRDPRKFHYSCMPCLDYRKGTCKRGDLCEYAHGVFECWLHPAQYKTRLCKDGMSCLRQVCFFAHKPEEMRPVYVSTGSAMPSPHSATSAAAFMDMAAALNLLPGSPKAVQAMLPSPFSPPISPGNGISDSCMAWPQKNIPSLHLPESNLRASRLRSSLNARDIPTEEVDLLHNFELQQQQPLHDVSSFSQSFINISSVSHPLHPETLTPSNLNELFSAQVSSPRMTDHLVNSYGFSPSNKPAVRNQLQQQQTILSPIRTNAFSPRTFEQNLLQAPFDFSSPRMMSHKSIEPLSPIGSRVSALAQHEKQKLQQLYSFSARDVGSNVPRELGSNGAVGSPVPSLSKWESANGKLDWSVQTDELGHLTKFCSGEHNVEEPDVSWVQSLVKESPYDVKAVASAPESGTLLSIDCSN
ncbi:PREDICTED: zinc finger CCCH domain-containing protein 56-like [Prunus mume]|uniref:Zinc finger CCCH domain-containing protein 56-like n=1 Tax=Prunus mume TaxID=102107 RepID=A0ABM0NN81_PRUMU|nr:PREDICTED: zinc finger CCCH domain-containing protein 56-like [Prunus mume]